MIRPSLAAAGVLLAAAASLGTSSAPDETRRGAPARGTRGIVRTALEGSRVVELPLVFLGVYENALGPGHDLYLVRIEGDRAEHFGVASGMSGSPVLVDGRVIGALSYRIGSFSKEAVAGVTPIEDMLNAGSEVSAKPPADATGFAPIATPVQLGGVTGPVRDLLRPELESRGFLPVVGGAESAGDPNPHSIEPGSPVGVALVRGDMNVAATGTVTWIDGERVFAFGHPFLGSGRVEIPLVNASVVYTVPALAGSFKLTNVGAEIGAVLEDRLTTVVGRLDARARMIPLHLTVEGEDLGGREYRFEVVRQSQLTPFLAGAAVANALVLSNGYDDEATVRASGTIRLKGLPDLPLELALASGRGAHPFAAIAAGIQSSLDALYRNPFAEPEVEAIDLAVSVRRERIRYRVEGIHLDRGPVLPGERLEVSCTLRGYRGERRVRKIELQLPEDLAPGTKLALVVGSAAAVDRALGRRLDRRIASARDLETVVRILGEVHPADGLEAVVYRSSPGAIARGTAHESLPPTAAHLLASTAAGVGARSTRIAILSRATERLDGPVEGGVITRLDVERGSTAEDHP